MLAWFLGRRSGISRDNSKTKKEREKKERRKKRVDELPLRGRERLWISREENREDKIETKKKEMWKKTRKKGRNRTTMEQSEAFWVTFGTVYEQERNLRTSDNSTESDVHTSVEGRKKRRRRTTSTSTRMTTTTSTSFPRAKKSERGRGRIFSIWADGNLRLLHIGLCAAEVLCNSRARLLPSLSRPLLSSSFPSSITSSSSPSFVFLHPLRFSLHVRACL